MMRFNRQFWMTWLFLSIGILVSGCGGLQQAGLEDNRDNTDDASWPMPVAIKDGKDTIRPGLAVWYYNKKIRHIGRMPDPQQMIRKGFQGAPIERIAHRFGKGEVFGSGASRGICVQMSGFLEFSKTGRYELKANSNDGIRVFLDQKMILNDPDVHSDRYTPPTSVEVPQPGRYPILLRYFQRKGTATLELYWKEPGADQFTLIPASAYSHRPETQ